MESYKHSCPCCGQHIEYTAGYCGRQMQCPICGRPVTFPAIPPGRAGQKAAARDTDTKPSPKWSWTLPGFLLYLREFQHWNVVALCAVPFLIVGVLLVGAALVKKNFVTTPPPAATPAVQADRGAWQRMTDLAKADEAVRAQIRAVNTARKAVALAEQIRASTATSEPMQKRAAEEQLYKAQHNLDLERKRFETIYANYQRLGGAVDYHNQLQN